MVGGWRGRSVLIEVALDFSTHFHSAV